MLSKILAWILGALRTKGDTTPLQKKGDKKPSFEKRLREHQRNQRAN